MPLPALIGVGAMLLRGGSVAATIAPLVKPAIGAAKRFLQRGVARPGIGSRVTRGPLKVGKQTVYGPARPGTGAVLRTGAVALGVGAVASRTARRGSSRPKAQPQPQRARSTSRATKTGERKCCPAGTRRMVCFKRGRRKKGTKRRASAKQLANQRRFAAAARARRRRG